MQKGQVQKSCCQALIHNSVYKIQKGCICNTIKPSAPTVQHSQKLELEIMRDKALALNICWFLSFHAHHQIATGTNVQIPRTELFFNLLLQATKTSSTLEG